MGFVSTGQSLEFCLLYECHDECLKLAVASQLPCALGKTSFELESLLHKVLCAVNLVTADEKNVALKTVVFQ